MKLKLSLINTPVSIIILKGTQVNLPTDLPIAS